MTRLKITHEQDFPLDFEEISENYQGAAFGSLYVDLTSKQLEKVVEHLAIVASAENPYHSLWMTHAHNDNYWYIIFSFCVGMDRDAILYEKHAQITTYNPHNMFKNKSYNAQIYFYSPSNVLAEEKNKKNRVVLRIEKPNID